MQTQNSSEAESGRLAVLIPALDEELTLPAVLAAIRERTDALVVVVDNGSTDRTVEVAQAAGATVIAEPERGYGAACLRGIAYLADRPSMPDALVFLDADHAHGPDQIEALADPVLRGDADLVLGVRRRAGDHVGTVFPHARLGNRLVLALVRLLFGHRFRDLPPFRAIAFGKLLELGMDDRNWGWTLQMQIRAADRAFRIWEMEVLHERRVAGRSKISGSVTGTLRAGSKMLFTLLRERFRRRS